MKKYNRPIGPYILLVGALLAVLLLSGCKQRRLPAEMETPIHLPPSTVVPLSTPQAEADSPVFSPGAEALAMAQRERALAQLGLIDIRLSIPDAMVDMRYASENNFTGKAVYPSDTCLLSIATGHKLIAAAEELREMGYRIKIYDAYRPVSCQRALYEAAPDKRFVANPDGAKGSNHSRAAAVDITICDMEGNEIAMPSDFDDFTSKASRQQSSMPEDVEQNLRMVEDVMVHCGFKPLAHEWWHYDDTDAADMPVLDVALDVW